MDYFHDKELALERIANEGLNYRIRTPRGLLLEESNFKEAREMHEQEKEIVGEHTDDELFRGLVYCVLTQMQDYGTQMYVFHRLLDNGCDTIEGTLANRGELPKFMQSAIYNKNKTGYILGVADQWDEINIREILENPNQQEARKQLMKRTPGIALKTGSLFLRMCGMEQLVPIDSWMMGMLYLHGYPVEIERMDVKREFNNVKQRKRPVNGQKYLDAESHTQDLAGKYKQPPFLLQLAFWTHHSAFRRVPKRTLFDGLVR
jgi:thermostable 8-oxoguanine DNA glycosylase